MKHEDWMRLALDQAQKAYECNEIPVGALVVVNQQILSVAFNEKEQKQDPTGHAEVLAIRRAAEVMGHWRLTDATLYVTLEPCPMCAGAILQARLKHLVYGATDAKGGAVESVMNVLNRNCWNHKVEVTAGVLEEECSVLLKQYFREKRTKA
ncbi:MULTISPECIES: tRNA adenosine(34) deaminase TadA [unclassified Dehalobacter]|jgi:Cytosine/adenosine deaminases|uniref:tRNA adenosine(34) deaminase TadA n=1 Tax=unclassified Dehalobacter TaxID=2635733 RepID=UPI00028AAB15|nr:MULTISPECIES: tRNA adenosine(34) deaminase TadA [unclassified Dehalobacter]AFV04016.1 tRNA-specific adenosine-34 deaminase [Dehalobacter sp. CF]